MNWQARACSRMGGTKSTLSHNHSPLCIDPQLVFGAQCTVVEPEPRQEHCLLAVALSMAQRRWMVELSLKGWLQALPRLIVTNCELGR